MKFGHLFLFTALFLVVRSVPLKKTFFVSGEKDFENTVHVPAAVGIGYRQDHTRTSALSKTTFTSNTTSFTHGTRTASTSDNTPPASGAPPAGIGGCVSCSVDNFNLVNDYRVSSGLSRLSWSNTLAYHAEHWSKHMFESRVFEHSDYPYWENIAWAYKVHTWTTAANGFFEEWRKSPDHDENMRLSSHACMGVGIYGDGTLIYATQIFTSFCA